jgi:hypothetical protein
LNKQCLSVEKNVLLNIDAKCDTTYNWYSCITVNKNCKFYKNECVAVTDTETCTDLSTTIPKTSTKPEIPAPLVGP